LRLDGETCVLGHIGRRQPRTVVGPGLGQIQRTVDEGMAVARDQRREHANLAVRDLARRAGVLPPHATGCPALLEKSGLINDQNRIIGGECLDDIVAHKVAQGVSIPTSTAQNGLLTPWARITRSLRAHPSGLAPLIAQQPIQE